MKLIAWAIFFLLFSCNSVDATDATFTWRQRNGMVAGYKIYVETVSTGRVVSAEKVCPFGAKFCCEYTMAGLKDGTKYKAWATTLGIVITKDILSLEESAKSNEVEFIAGESADAVTLQPER